MAGPSYMTLSLRAPGTTANRVISDKVSVRKRGWGELPNIEDPSPQNYNAFIGRSGLFTSPTR